MTKRVFGPSKRVAQCLFAVFAEDEKCRQHTWNELVAVRREGSIIDSGGR
jgi:hypothetical protein